MKFITQDLRNPLDSTVEFIRLEDFFYTHRGSHILQSKLRILLLSAKIYIQTWWFNC